MSRIVSLSKFIADRIQRKRHQFRVDTFRAGGKGGQNQNKVESGVRITDLVTGLSAEGRDQRKQEQNRANAFFRLCDKMIEHYRKEEIAARLPKPEAARAIRTYKLTEGIVIDHRINQKFDSSGILEGRLDGLFEKLLVAGRQL